MPLLALLLACGPPGGPDTGVTGWPPTGTPSLECLWITCDPDADRWRVEATTTAWTGGALLYLADDPDWVEEHYVRSVEAAADGRGDRLRLDLDVAPDWRHVTPGSSTAFQCTDDPAALLVVLDQDQVPATCARRGDATVWEAVEGLPPCPGYEQGLCRPR